MATEPSGHVALVTGGGNGIGAAIGVALAPVVGTIVIADRDLAAAQRSAAQLERLGCSAHALAADVTDEKAVAGLFDEVRDVAGPVDILINNVGGGTVRPGHPTSMTTSELDPGHFRHVLELNVLGTFLCTRAALPDMVERKWGRIVNMASSAAYTPFLPASVAYATAKSSIIGFTRFVAIEHARDGITCNALAPGITATDRVMSGFVDGDPAWLQDLPLGRPADVREIASAAAYLCSPSASYVTGTTMNVTGGWSLH